MAEFIEYYAVFNDGSVVQRKSLSEVLELQHSEFLLKERTFDTEHQRLKEFVFIDSEGKAKNLRLGEWELLELPAEDVFLRLNPSQKYCMKYKLLNHATKTVFTFERYVRSVEFFQEELFPKLFELNKATALLCDNVNLTLTKILIEVTELRKQIDLLVQSGKPLI